MIASGSQVRAARAFLGMSREVLAQIADVNADTVKYWEAKERVPTRVEPWGIERMRIALEARGVRFTADPAPGVCLSGRNRKAAA